jgi:hypothetical protein
MTEHTLAYVPAGPITKAFHESAAFVRGIMGPVGSGKSTACVIEILRRAKKQAPGPDGIRRSRWAIIRNTFPELRTTTLKTWEAWAPTGYGRFTLDSPIVHHIKAGDLDAEVLFLALDVEGDQRKLLSLELTGAWVNEAREIPRSIIDVLTTRVGRYPSARDGGCTWSGILLDTNPPDTEHWWYQLAEEQTPESWRFFKQPSGLADNAENLHNLNQSAETVKLGIRDPVRVARGRGYYTRIAEGKKPEWLQVYVRGEYGLSFDGKPVFAEYHDNLHALKEAPKAFKNETVHVGIDFGLTPAAVFLQQDGRGRWVVLSELVAEDMGMESFSRLIREELKATFPNNRVHIVCDPAGLQRSQVDERTPVKILKGLGVPVETAPTNDLLVRLEAVRQPLSRLIDGAPGLMISPRCVRLRKALAGGYSYKRMRVSGTERFHDIPDKNEFSHVADALQYALLGAGEAFQVFRKKRREGPLLCETEGRPDY